MAKKKVKRKSEKKKRVIGVFRERKKYKSQHKRRRVKGQTELRRFGKENNKTGQVKSVSIRFENPYKSLERFADHLQEGTWFQQRLRTIYYRNKNEVGLSIPPFTCAVIIEQRHREKPQLFFYEAYFLPVGTPAIIVPNIKNFTVNTVRNHPEAIRRKLNRMGFTDVRYTFENFKPFHVPSIRVELLYE